ncbi:lipocalin-like domain-containing protein [uncultured Ferrimonas sp.]|uniref:lipocalin-like domain-containing protein n=1 Tax=uncultured Ferrimonas sp. TaxID=432640 RepID=UPI002624E287|nr:lipocalin-like domain-containing protein [uncultured Ferrimonas sp.]
MIRVLFFAVVLISVLVLVGYQSPPSNHNAMEEGTKVVPGYPISFPLDHGPHNDYGLEWWYLTANLTDENGEHHGLQYTLFRFRGPQGEQGPWWQGQWYMAHLMWEHQGKHQAWERFGRGAGQAGVESQPFAAWLDDWRLASVGESYQPLSLQAGNEIVAFDLLLTDSPLILHGDNGYSDKSGDGSLASYYYTLPRLQLSGALTVAGQRLAVTGTAWLDREWSSALLDQRFSGWDWLALNLDDGNNLMLFCLRGSGSNPSNCEATWMSADGDSQHLDADQFQLRPLQTVQIDDGSYPVSWQVMVPSKQLDLTVISRSQDQLNRLTTTYWEGPATVSGSHNGYGFIEMTGRGQ